MAGGRRFELATAQTPAEVTDHPDRASSTASVCSGRLEPASQAGDPRTHYTHHQDQTFRLVSHGSDNVGVIHRVRENWKVIHKLLIGRRFLEIIAIVMV